MTAYLVRAAATAALVALAGCVTADAPVTGAVAATGL
jgi:hypothetical protein